MNIKCQFAVLFVSDIEKSKEFYTKVLGLSIKMDMGDNVIFENGIALWQVPEGHIIYDKITNKNDKKKNQKSFELYLEAEDIESINHKLQDNGVRFFHDLREEPWGQKTVRLYDPDENLIEIGESLPTFLQRMD
ncbi:MAG: glyoxalase/bleomycin resistance/dioxygenase family protein [Candidatus Marinimicrobia bacterium]|nr:glyoxalase/bleomycin resistance/dioxygenase family protein [Candidatus Neomarinimicrobiota bacterium]